MHWPAPARGARSVSPLHTPARATSACSDLDVSTPGHDRVTPVYAKPLEAPISKSTASHTGLAHGQGWNLSAGLMWRTSRKRNSPIYRVVYLGSIKIIFLFAKR